MREGFCTLSSVCVLTLTGMCNWSLCLCGGVELKVSWRERAGDEATLEAAETGWAGMWGNQSFSITSTWSKVFRYFSLQKKKKRKEDKILKWGTDGNAVAQENIWIFMILQIDIDFLWSLEFFCTAGESCNSTYRCLSQGLFNKTWNRRHGLKWRTTFLASTCYVSRFNNH